MFYQISAKVDAPKEVGTIYPQAHCLTQKEAAHRLRHAMLPDFLPELRFELNKGAKLTDLLSEVAIMAHGVLISERMKKWVASFNLGQHAFYPTRVFTRDGQEHPYFYLQILPIPFEALDFAQSEFIIKDLSAPTKNIAISSYEEYLVQKEELGHMRRIKIKQAVLSHAFDRSLDLFAIPVLDGRLLVSEGLNDGLAKEGFTGINRECASNVSMS